MRLEKAYHFLSEEKIDAIMTLAREGASLAIISRGAAEPMRWLFSGNSPDSSLPRGIPLKERRKRYEAMLHTRDRIEEGNFRSFLGCIRTFV